MKLLKLLFAPALFGTVAALFYVYVLSYGWDNPRWLLWYFSGMVVGCVWSFKRYL